MSKVVNYFDAFDHYSHDKSCSIVKNKTHLDKIYTLQLRILK